MDYRFQTHHGAYHPMPAHRHAQPYLALVERGAYLEFSVDGVFRCEPGMAVIHPRFHLHGNRFLDPKVAVTNVVLPRIGCYGVVRLSKEQAQVARRVGDAATLMGLIEAGDPVAPEPVPAAVHVAAARLRADPALRVDDAAALVMLSPEHLCRLFKRHLGLSPSAYRSERRLQSAMLDLKTGQPAAAVAHRWGFSDQAHLCRSVKAATGHTIGSLCGSDSFKTTARRIH